MLREIVLLTETTGTDQCAGSGCDRYGLRLEACIQPHSRTASYSSIFNRNAPASAGDARRVDGLSRRRVSGLRQMPLLPIIALPSRTIIPTRDSSSAHIAPFDAVGFLNAESGCISAMNLSAMWVRGRQRSP